MNKNSEHPSALVKEKLSARDIVEGMFKEAEQLLKGAGQWVV